MLHTGTVEPQVYQLLEQLSALPELAAFNLVGGTSLALQIGHRKSDDLDFFTDHSFDNAQVKSAVAHSFPSALLLNERRNGMTFNIPVGLSEPVKIDIYNWGVPFIKPAIAMDAIRLCSLEDIAANKLDAVCSRKLQKDYVDIAVLLDRFTFAELMGFHKAKYPYADSRVVLTQITNVEGLMESPNPVMLTSLTATQAISIIEQKVERYGQELVAKKLKKLDDRDEQIRSLLEKKKQHPRGGLNP